MAARKSRRRRQRTKNPVSLSPKLHSRVISLIEGMERVEDESYRLASHVGNNRLGKLLESAGKSLESVLEELEDEIGSKE